MLTNVIPTASIVIPNLIGNPLRVLQWFKAMRSPIRSGKGITFIIRLPLED